MSVCVCNPINTTAFNKLWNKFQAPQRKGSATLFFFHSWRVATMIVSVQHCRPGSVIHGSLLQCVLSRQWRQLAERCPKLVMCCILTGVSGHKCLTNCAVRAFS